MQKTWNS